MTFTPTAEEDRHIMGLFASTDENIGDLNEDGQNEGEIMAEEEASVEREFDFVPLEGADDMRVSLEWAAQPEDFDLKLFKVEADGSRTPIGKGSGSDPGSSGNLPGTFEEIVVTDPQPGKYVLRVIYYATAANDWTAKVEQRRQGEPKFIGTGKTEAYTLACETADGTVLGSRQVTIGRGQQMTLSMPAGCK
jgi:hypothetical protein